MNTSLSLSGRRIVVTRAREQSPELAARLLGLGAEVLELPLITVSKEIDSTRQLISKNIDSSFGLLGK